MLINVARIVWQAEKDSTTTINADSGRISMSEWDFMRSGRAMQFWDDTKSESSSMSERKPSSRGYAKHGTAHPTETENWWENYYVATLVYWQSRREKYSHYGTWESRRLARSASV